MAGTIKHWLPTLSLREFLAIVAFVGVACGALLNASPGWVSLLLILLWLLTLGLFIVAFVERGRRQAAAVGALAAWWMYGLLWVQELTPEITTVPKVDAVGQVTMDQKVKYSGPLATSKVLAWLWPRVASTYIVDVRSNTVVRRESPAPSSLHGIPVPPSQYPGSGQFAANSLHYKVLPEPTDFFTIGHWLWAILLAYLGGKFAVWVYKRRVEYGVARE